MTTASATSLRLSLPWEATDPTGQTDGWPTGLQEGSLLLRVGSEKGAQGQVWGRVSCCCVRQAMGTLGHRPRTGGPTVRGDKRDPEEGGHGLPGPCVSGRRTTRHTVGGPAGCPSEDVSGGR